MQDDLTGGNLGGDIEIDETFIGGKARNMHQDRKARAMVNGPNKGKVVVLGMLERKGRIRATVIPDRSTPVMRDHVRGNIDQGSVLFSDDHAGHWKMDEEYKHQIVNHAEQYVDGQIHTNGLENFWSLLKRGLHGTYISVEPFHLFRYIDEQAFRFNHRKDMNDSDRFRELASRVVGKRLTFAEVTGKVGKKPDAN
jgi:transposase-like protein